MSEAWWFAGLCEAGVFRHPSCWRRRKNLASDCELEYRADRDE